MSCRRNSKLYLRFYKSTALKNDIISSGSHLRDSNFLKVLIQT